MTFCAMALGMVAVSVAQQVPSPSTPKITTLNNEIQIEPVAGTKARVLGDLHVAGELHVGLPSRNVAAELAASRFNLSTMAQNQSIMAQTIVQLQSELSSVRQAAFNNITEIGREFSRRMDALNDTLGRRINDSTVQLYRHVVTTVNESHNNLSTAMIDNFDNVTVAFNEVDRRLTEAGVWEYSFSGNSRISDNFAYWFSIDHGGQGAVNNPAGITDSYHCGNWFLDVEAKSGHCGGGCHVDYFRQRLYLNGYCSKSTLQSNTQDVSAGSSWSVNRVADGHNSHGSVCHTFNVRHSPGRYSFGGPYWIKIRSTKPLIVLHSYPWGSCSFRQSNYMLCRGCNNRNAYTVYQSRTCPRHKVPPSECRYGRPASQSLGFYSDPQSPNYNSSVTSVCCMNCN